jgi:aminoglycoside phosphotransferase (APT) family kinase protein
MDNNPPGLRSCRRMSAVIADLTRIAEGREAEIFAWEEGRVLRLFRGARMRESLEREAAAMRAVRSVVPLVPEVFDIIEFDGRPGMVMERVDGPDLITLLGSKPWLVWSAGVTLGRAHAQLNATPAPPQLETLKSRLRRVFSRDEVPPEPRERMFALLDSLPDGDRVCHGDFHPGNVLMSERGPVVIDWPNASAGDPAADFARSDLLLRMGDPPPGTPALVKYMQGIGRKLINAAYRRTYLRERPTDMELIRRWQVVRIGDRLVDDGIEVERERLTAMLRDAGVL